MKNEIHLNDQYVTKFLPNEISQSDELKKLLNARNQLKNKSGLGAEFTDWLDYIDESSEKIILQQQALVDSLKKHCQAVVVVGIGGSLLGTKAIYECLRSSFSPNFSPSQKNNVQLFWAGHHLDSMELHELLNVLEYLEYGIVVISKSGGTTEPALAFRILKEHLEKKIGKEKAQQRIVAITDPKQGRLLKIAHTNKYPTLPIPSGIGGRYSVFTAVGLFPLALAGIDVLELIQGAKAAKQNAMNDELSHFDNNVVLRYAGYRNLFYANNYKIEALCSWTPKAKGLAEWWKQLFGESDGKNHSGLFPASANFTTDLHSLGQYFQQGERHLIATHIQFGENQHVPVPFSELDDGFEFLQGKPLSFVQDKAQQGTYLAHSQGGVPLMIWEIPQCSAYWIGAWMMCNLISCAISGYARNINPFDQPGVEEYKKNMFQLMGKS